MSRRFSRIYLAITPLWFLLSWYISHELYNYSLRSRNTIDRPYPEHSLIYATGFVVAYLVFYFILRDLYPMKKKITS